MPKKETEESLKEKLIKIHGNSVTVDFSTYKNANANCRFFDIEHGEFWARPGNVINCASRHPTRARLSAINKLQYTKEEIIENLCKTHGDLVTIDISTYIDMDTLCKFYDVDYGEFWNLPSVIITRGGSCKQRGDQKRIETNLIKFGTASALQNKQVREKSKQTCMQKYNTEFATQSDIIKQKSKKTCLEKYNTDCVLKNPQIQEIIKKKWLEKTPVELKKIAEKRIATSLAKYGTENPAQHPEFIKQSARNSWNSKILFHWKTGEELVARGSWEALTIEYLNKNQIEYVWQPKSFAIPKEILTTKAGRQSYYNPDLYLINDNKYIEIKGWLGRNQISKMKWEWFHSAYPNSELWQKQELNKLGIAVK